MRTKRSRSRLLFTQQRGDYSSRYKNIFKILFCHSFSFFLKKSHLKMNIFLYCSCNAHLCYICIFFFIVVARIRKSTEHLWFNMNNLYLNVFIPVVFQIWYGGFGFSVLFSVRFPFRNFQNNITNNALFQHGIQVINHDSWRISDRVENKVMETLRSR